LKLLRSRAGIRRSCNEYHHNDQRGHPMNISRAWHTTAVISALATAPLSAAHAASNPPGAPGAAAFVHHADMRDWLADGDHGLWIQAGNLEWFYAAFSGACHGLNSTNSIEFDTRSSGNIDRTTSVVVPGGGRCLMHSFARSGGPPKNRNADVVPQPQEQ
jgi:hypothetical protein